LKLKHRSLFSMIVRMPQIFLKHYKILRQYNSIKESCRVAFLLSTVMLKTRRK